MTDLHRVILLPLAMVGSLALGQGAHAACVGAGVVTRIDGQPQDLTIVRGGAPVTKPRVLEVVCDGDTVQVRAPAAVTLAINGAGPVRVTAATVYHVANRSTRPTVAANAYAALSDKVLKDMKRQPWDVRLRGGEPPLSFGVEGLTSGGQQASAGRRDLLIRVVGGSPGYHVALTGPGGIAFLAESETGGAVLLRNVDLGPGAWRIEATDRAGAHISGGLQVVTSSAPSPSYDGIDDAEVRAAVEAADLARQSPGVWAFESEQRLNAAPRASLDRESVYRLIESYGAGG